MQHVDQGVDPFLDLGDITFGEYTGQGVGSHMLATIWTR
jgi:hypothetical protein